MSTYSVAALTQVDCTAYLIFSFLLAIRAIEKIVLYYKSLKEYAFKTIPCGSVFCTHGDSPT